MLEKTEGTISRMDNPETLATLDTHVTYKMYLGSIKGYQLRKY
jgi:hypothetical protein